MILLSEFDPKGKRSASEIRTKFLDMTYALSSADDRGSGMYPFRDDFGEFINPVLSRIRGLNLEEQKEHVTPIPRVGETAMGFTLEMGRTRAHIITGAILGNVYCDVGVLEDLDTRAYVALFGGAEKKSLNRGVLALNLPSEDVLKEVNTIVDKWTKAMDKLKEACSNDYEVYDHIAKSQQPMDLSVFQNRFMPILFGKLEHLNEQKKGKTKR